MKTLMSITYQKHEERRGRFGTIEIYSGDLLDMVKVGHARVSLEISKETLTTYLTVQHVEIQCRRQIKYSQSTTVRRFLYIKKLIPILRSRITTYIRRTDRSRRLNSAASEIP